MTSEFLLLTAVVALLLLLLAAVLYSIRLQRRWPKPKDPREALRVSLREEEQERQSRAYLSSLIELPEASLPPLRRWAAAADFLIVLAETILREKPQTVVEFGSGVSTAVTLRCLELNGSGTLLSFEHVAAFAEISRFRAKRWGFDSDVRAVQLMPAPSGYEGQWYDAKDLPARIDLITVDGPPAVLHPETRGGAATAFARLSPGGVILLDDARRKGERAIVERWRERFPDIEFDFLDTLKGTVIGRRRT